ncbi:lambda family phage portal protein [Labrenzia sp. EL_126]|nr:lambda family phage portal protein [Labrenzia sp. EL_126]
MAKSNGLIDQYGNPLRARRSAQPTARYLRDTRSGIIASRMVPLTESRDDIRSSWSRAAALALDLIKNSGRLRGAADQVIADTVGSGLKLMPTPDFTGLDWSDDEIKEWKKLVKKRWHQYRANAKEVDFRGKFNLSKLVEIALRYDMAYGEVTALLEYMPGPLRRRYGIETGTKLCMVPPHRLVQDTNEFDNLFQGVRQDENGRPIGYLFEERQNGLTTKKMYAAQDSTGRDTVLHIFNPMCATDMRGISVLASAFRKHIQHEMLDDATLQTAILQTIFAATLTSEKPTMEAFEALESLKDNDVKNASDYADEYVTYLKESLSAAADDTLRIGGDPQVSHLAPGEELDLKSTGTPGPHYQPFSSGLSRDTARAIGITYGALTMDHSSANYSSVRMENSSIWPVVERRRSNTAAPIERAVYQSWLDESIFMGRLPFKGGYGAFLTHRPAVSAATFQGPPQPTADDGKSAKASTERIQNGTSSVDIEAANLGIDPDELFEQIREGHEKYVAAGMISPYDRNPGGSNDNDDDDDEDEKKPQRANA